MTQSLQYKDFEFTTTTTTLDGMINTDDDSDYGYYIVFDSDYNDIRKDRTEHLALMPLKRKIIDNELGYREKEKCRAKTKNYF